MSVYKCQLESRSRYNNRDKDRRAIPWWNRHFTSISQTLRGVLCELANVRNPGLPETVRPLAGGTRGISPMSNVPTFPCDPARSGSFVRFSQGTHQQERGLVQGLSA
jgi:hypothetical protein